MTSDKNHSWLTYLNMPDTETALKVASFVHLAECLGIDVRRAVEKKFGLVRECVDCGRRFLTDDGKDRRCWECQGYEIQPLGKVILG